MSVLKSRESRIINYPIRIFLLMPQLQMYPAINMVFQKKHFRGASQ